MRSKIAANVIFRPIQEYTGSPPSSACRFTGGATWS
jgi:hypothetical protein